MKNRTFLVSSLFSLLLALGLQIVGWCNLTAQVQSALLKFSLMPILPGLAPDDPHDADVFRAMIWCGLVLAILGLGCLIASFRRREAGTPLAPGALLTLYVGTWVFLLCTSGL